MRNIQRVTIPIVILLMNFCMAVKSTALPMDLWESPNVVFEVKNEDLLQRVQKILTTASQAGSFLESINFNISDERSIFNGTVFNDILEEDFAPSAMSYQRVNFKEGIVSLNGQGLLNPVSFKYGSTLQPTQKIPDQIKQEILYPDQGQPTLLASSSGAMVMMILLGLVILVLRYTRATRGRPSMPIHQRVSYT